MIGTLAENPDQESTLVRAIADVTNQGAAEFRHASLTTVAWSTSIEVDRAIIAISARDGPLHQTREMLLRLRATGVARVVVALTDAELSEEQDFLELVEMECRQLLNDSGFPGDEVPIVVVSPHLALQGDSTARNQMRVLLDTLDEYQPSPFDMEGELVGEIVCVLSREFLRRFSGVESSRVEFLGVQSEQGNWWVPEFQFSNADKGVVEPVIIKVHDSLAGGEDPEGAYAWWVTPNPWLRGARPVDLIGTGRDDEIQAAAEQTSMGNW